MGGGKTQKTTNGIDNFFLTKAWGGGGHARLSKEKNNIKNIRKTLILLFGNSSKKVLLHVFVSWKTGSEGYDKMYVLRHKFCMQSFAQSCQKTIQDWWNYRSLKTKVRPNSGREGGGKSFSSSSKFNIVKNVVGRVGYVCFLTNVWNFFIFFLKASLRHFY